jgi:lysophospholipase L1-like esterase
MTRTQLINIIRQSITDALARQNTAGVVRGVLETLVNGMPNEDDPSQVGSYLPPITEDEYGFHPAAPTGADQIEYLYRRLGNVSPLIIPAAPTNGSVDDQGDRFSFDITPGYTSAAEYEYTEPNATGGIVKLTALNSYINGTRVTITGLTGPIPTGQLKVRVAATGGISAGKWLASNAPFTGSVIPPATGDTILPVITFIVPASGAVIAPNTPVTLTVNATDNVGVQSVSFTNGATGALIGAGAKNGNAYTYNYTTGAAGPLTIVATAYDAAGNLQSATVNVTVQSSAPATSKANAPSFGAIDDVNDLVTLTSQYSYTRVRWGIEGQGPQALASNSICSPGNIVGRLFAYVIADATANETQSDTVYSQPFTLAAAANQAPSATVSVVGGVTSVSAGQTVVLAGNGTDPDTGDTVVKLEYLDNGVKIGETPGASGSLQTSGLTSGTHNMTVRATDSKGAIGISNAVVITVGAPAQQNVLVPVTANFWNNGGIERTSGGQTIHAALSMLKVNLNGASSATITAFNTGAGGILVLDGTAVVGSIGGNGSPQDFAFNNLSGGTLTCIFGAQQRSYEIGEVQGSGITKVTLPNGFAGNFIAPQQATTAIVIIGDSISNGSGASVPQQKGWTTLLRNNTQTTYVTGYGSAQGLVAGAQGNWPTLRDVITKSLAGATNKLIIWACGSNDALGAQGPGACSLADYMVSFNAFLANSQADFPTVPRLIFTPIYRQGEATTNNGYGWKLQDLRDAETQAASGKPLTTVLDGYPIIKDPDLSDTAHPNDIGHQKIANYIQPVIDAILGNADILSPATNLTAVPWVVQPNTALQSNGTIAVKTSSNPQNSFDGGGVAPKLFGTTAGAGEKGRVHIDTSIVVRGATKWGSVTVGVNTQLPNWSATENGFGIVYRTIGPAFYYDDEKFGLIEYGAALPFVTKKWTDYATNPDLDIVVTESRIKFYVNGKLFYTATSFTVNFPLYIAVVLATAADGTYPASQAKVTYQGVNLIDPPTGGGVSGPAGAVIWHTPPANGGAIDASGNIIYQNTAPSTGPNGDLWGGGFNSKGGFVYPTGNDEVTVTAPAQVINRQLGSGGGVVWGVSNNEQKGDYRTQRHAWYWDGSVVRVFELGVKLFEAALPVGNPDFAIKFTATSITYYLNGSPVALQTASTIGLPSGNFWVTAALSTPGDASGSGSTVRNVTLAAPNIVPSGF